MSLSKITTKGILDGTIKTADLQIIPLLQL